MTRRLAPIAVSLAATMFLACGPTSTLSDDNGGGGGGGGGSVDAGGDNCVGGQCQNHCPNGTMTTISGVVKAPNGIDPVPQALVYVPREITEFPSEVQCEVCDQLSDVAIVSTSTDYDGSFTLGPIPTGENQQPGSVTQLVAQKGRFRKLADVTVTNVCAPNTAGANDFTMPSRSNGYNSIPKIAVATGDYDVMECVLLNIGLENGSFDLFNGVDDLFGGGTPGSVGNLDTLLGDLTRMKSYNIIFVNCANNTYESALSNPTVRSNIDQYVKSGGRLYVTDWSYDYVEQIDSFASIIDFGPDATAGVSPEPMNAAAIGADGITTEATVQDDGLRRWLEATEVAAGEEIINASGQVHIEHFLASWVMQLMVDTSDNAKVWLTGQVSGNGLSGDLPLTTTFDYAQCGRVLYSSYHTEGRDLALDPFGTASFPSYCSSTEMTPQERVLEYLIFHIADCITVD